VTWDPALKRPQMITSLEWDPMSWMTSNYEVEIRARSMEDGAEREVFCSKFCWTLEQKTQKVLPHS
jgi:hypothetical protein